MHYFQIFHVTQKALSVLAALQLWYRTLYYFPLQEESIPTKDITKQHECLQAKLLQSCLTLWFYGLPPTRLLCPWDSPGENTGVCCHAQLQGTFNPSIKPASLVFPALAGRFFTTSATREAHKAVPILPKISQKKWKRRFATNNPWQTTMFLQWTHS